jgi:flagellar biosynthetic protein FliO
MCLSFVAVLQGQEAVQTTQEAESVVPKDPSGFGQEGFGSALVKTILSLGVVIALVYFTTFGIKRFLTRSKGRSSASIRVLGSTLLGPKKGIYIIEVESRRLLLGVTEATISYLTELEENAAEAMDHGGLAGPPSGSSSAGSGTAPRTVGSTFKDMFDGFMKRRGDDAK